MAMRLIAQAAALALAGSCIPCIPGKIGAPTQEITYQVAIPLIPSCCLLLSISTYPSAAIVLCKIAFLLNFRFNFELKMSNWWPTGRSSNQNWHFDIVGLLAVLGEASAEGVSELITASWICALPRLMPAPHSLLKASRRYDLPGTTDVRVIGVYSGTRYDELGYFPSLIHNIKSMKPYEFRVCQISYAERGVKNITGEEQTGACRTPPAAMAFLRLSSPLAILVYVSVFMTAGLFACAVILRDGVAAIALMSISFASTFMNLASRWVPLTISLSAPSISADGDVVIVSRGGFTVVHCSEPVSKEIYFQSSTINYRMPDVTYYLVAGLGTLLLMAGVVLLGNCGWSMQLAVGGAYVLLNALYWLANLIPRNLNWNWTDRYEVRERKIASSRSASFTHALWLAIHETGETDWVETADIIPRTKAWKSWLRLARENCSNPDWDAVGEIKRIISDEAREVQRIRLSLGGSVRQRIATNIAVANAEGLAR